MERIQSVSKPDVNYESIADNPHPVSIYDRTIQPEDPSEWDDILKLSNAWAVQIIDCDINPSGGNREDGVDINRFSRDCVLKRCRVRAGAKYAFTIKGGSNYIKLDDIVIHGPRGKEGVDIDIGNYSSTHAMTHDININNVRREDGEPVTVRIGYGCDVNITNTNVKVLVVQSLLLKCYVWAKRTIIQLTNKLKGLIWA